MLNNAALRYLANADIIGFIGDDVRPRTENWAERIESEYESNAIIYCNDGWQGEGSLRLCLWMPE